MSFNSTVERPACSKHPPFWTLQARILVPRYPHDAYPQIYAYRGAIQHHGIVTHVPWAGQGDGASAASGVSPQSSGEGVQVVHFDSACDGVETTSLESFLKVSAERF